MAKYEIMLVVSGSLSEKEANSVAGEVSASIKACKPKVHEYGSKQLAYKIKKDTNGYYFQYNFDCESPAMINEFRRLASINKQVLRTLIINLEKDYGYRASVNPKKIERNKKTAEIHAKIKQEIEKAKAARDAERGINNESEKVEEKKATKKTTTKKAAVEIPADQKHTVVAASELETFSLAKRKKEWLEKAGNNDSEVKCAKCDGEEKTTILLDNNEHICYSCWTKKPADAASSTTKKTTKKK